MAAKEGLAGGRGGLVAGARTLSVSMEPASALVSKPAVDGPATTIASMDSASARWVAASSTEAGRARSNVSTRPAVLGFTLAVIVGDEGRRRPAHGGDPFCYAVFSGVVDVLNFCISRKESVPPRVTRSGARSSAVTALIYKRNNSGSLQGH